MSRASGPETEPPVEMSTMSERTVAIGRPCDRPLRTPPSPGRRRAALRQWLAVAVITALAAYAAADAVNAYAVVQGHLTGLPGFFHLV